MAIQNNETKNKENAFIVWVAVEGLYGLWILMHVRFIDAVSRIIDRYSSVTKCNEAFLNKFERLSWVSAIICKKIYKSAVLWTKVFSESKEACECTLRIKKLKILLQNATAEMLLDSASCIFNCSMNFDLLFNKLRLCQNNPRSCIFFPTVLTSRFVCFWFTWFVFKNWNFSWFKKKIKKIKFNFFFKIWILQTCSWWPTKYSEDLQNEYQNLFWLRISIYYFSCDFSTHFKKFSLFLSQSLRENLRILRQNAPFQLGLVSKTIYHCQWIVFLKHFFYCA